MKWCLGSRSTDLRSGPGFAVSRSRSRLGFKRDYPTIEKGGSWVVSIDRIYIFFTFCQMFTFFWEDPGFWSIKTILSGLTTQLRASLDHVHSDVKIFNSLRGVLSLIFPQFQLTTTGKSVHLLFRLFFYMKNQNQKNIIFCYLGEEPNHMTARKPDPL
jgi:hypothetical protein